MFTFNRSVFPSVSFKKKKGKEMKGKKKGWEGGGQAVLFHILPSIIDNGFALFAFYA